MVKYVVYKKALMPLVEPHEKVDTSKIDAKKILNKYHALLFSYYSDFDINNETSAWFVIKDSFGGMEELSSNTRNQVRKSLKVCNVRRITKEELATDDGYDVYNKFTSTYSKVSVSKCKFFEDVLNMNNRELFGVFDKESNKLISYSQNLVGDAVEYKMIRTNPDYLKTHYPFYSLFYKMNEYYLVEREKKYVNDGFRTLDNHSNIQDFLINKFKFRKAYCKVNIYYIWYIKIIISIMYPFRSYIQVNSISKILKMEEIRRKCK